MAATLDVRVNPKGAITGAAAAGSALDRLKVKASEVENRFVGLGRASERLGLAFRALTASFAIGGLFKLADAYTTVRNRLDLVSDSTAQAAMRFDVIKNLANETRAPLEETGKFFSQLTLNSKNLKLSFEETVGITRTLNQVIALTGQSTEASKNALIQLQQAFGSGALRGDELRSVMEQIPLLAQLIADKMGIGVGQLKDFAEQGLVTAKVVADALSSSAEEIDKAFQKSRFTFSQAFTILLNGLTAAIGRFNEATGLLQGLAKAIAWVGKEMELLGFIAITAATTFATVWAVGKIITFLTYMTSVQATMVTFRAGLVLTTGTMTGLQLAMARFTASIAAAKAAMIAFVVSNPFTLIAQAIVVVIGLLWQFRDAIVINRQTGATLGDLFIYALNRIRAAIFYVVSTFNDWFRSMQVYMPMIQALFSTFGDIAYMVFTALYSTVNTVVSIFNELGINMYTFIAILQTALGVFGFLVQKQIELVAGIFNFVKGLFIVNGELTTTGKFAKQLWEEFLSDLNVVAKELQATAALMKFVFVEGFKIVVDAAAKFFNWFIDRLNDVKAALNEFTDTFGFQAIAKTSNITVKGSMSASEYFNGMKNAYTRAYQSGGIKNSLKDAVRLGIDNSNEKNWFNDLANKQASTTDAVKESGNNVAKTTASGANSVASSVAANAASTASAISTLESALDNAASQKDDGCCCCDQRGTEYAGMNSNIDPSTGLPRSNGGTGSTGGSSGNGSWATDRTSGGGYSGSGNQFSGTYYLPGTSGVFGTATQLDPTVIETTRKEIDAANLAARASAEESARLAYGYQLLQTTLENQVQNGVLSAAEAASQFSTGLSFIKRGLDDPEISGKLRAAGETLFSNLIDQVTNAAVDSTDFLSTERVIIKDPGQKKGLYSGIDQITDKGFDATENPFEFISQFAKKTSTAVNSATTQVRAFTSALRSGTASITSNITSLAQQYNLLDLARRNVSEGAYAGINPNVRLDGFAKGGSFTVGGEAGNDKNLVQFMASRGEEVEIRNRRQQKESGSMSVANQISVSFNGVKDMTDFRRNKAEIEGSMLRAVRRQERLGR